MPVGDIVVDIPVNWTPGKPWPAGISAFEAGALILAVLAYPDPKDAKVQLRFRDAICARILIESARSDRNFASSSGLCYFLAEEPNRAREVTFRRGMLKVRDAMIAGRMFIHFLEKHWFGTQMPEDQRIGGVNFIGGQAASFLDDKFSGGSLQNILSRKWTPNKPVLHIAAALITVYLNIPNAPELGLAVNAGFGQPRWDVTGPNGMPDRLCELIREPEFVEGIVRWSKQALEIRNQTIADPGQAITLNLCLVS